MPTKITKATATQNSGSANITIPLALQRVVDRGRDRRCRGRGADQPLDDSARRVHRDAAYVRHRGGLGRSNRLLGLGKLRVELALQRLAALLGRGIELVADFGADRL